MTFCLRRNLHHKKLQLYNNTETGLSCETSQRSISQTHEHPIWVTRSGSENSDRRDKAGQEASAKSGGFSNLHFQHHDGSINSSFYRHSLLKQVQSRTSDMHENSFFARNDCHVAEPATHLT